MGKFETILTSTGDAVLQKRARNLSQATLETFEDEKRSLEKRIRNIENEVVSMEDLSVRSTQALVVGENLDTNAWVSKRINLVGLIVDGLIGPILESLGIIEIGA